MPSEREKWRKAVRNWERQVDRAEQGLEDSKVSATDFIGERPSFQPSQEYIVRIEAETSHLEKILTTNVLNDRKRAKVETQFQHLRAILATFGL